MGRRLKGSLLGGAADSWQRLARPCALLALLNLINDLARQKIGQNAAPARDPAQDASAPVLVGRAGGGSGLRLASRPPEDCQPSSCEWLPGGMWGVPPFSTPLPLALGSKVVCQVCSQAWRGDVVD